MAPGAALLVAALVLSALSPGAACDTDADHGELSRRRTLPAATMDVFRCGPTASQKPAAALPTKFSPPAQFAWR